MIPSWRLRKILLLLFMILLSLAAPSSFSAQTLNSRFGKNKVHYKAFQWATRETPHFVIYFYKGEERLAENTVNMAERAYAYLSETLHHEFEQKIPLIIYASSDDFQQTEVISGMLDEGIGGVTESLKGRIVIPFLGSYRSLNHVLVHELTHAFQFDILSGGRSGLGMFSAGLYVPLWFIEGMAEYVSEYDNPLTTMWLRDGVAQDSLPEPDQVERMQDIRVYRFGQSLWKYLVNTHGKEMLPELLHALAEDQPWEETIQDAAGTTWKEIYAGWRKEIMTTCAAAPNSGQRPLEEQAKALVRHQKKKFALNILPAMSPDGKYVAFVSDRDFYRTIYLASAETGKILRKLVEGERAGTFETLRYLNTSLTWSPDSTHIAFNAKAGGENAIYLQDIQTRNITKKLTPTVSSISFLAWSPTHNLIAFTGTKDGQEDLFLIDINTEEMTQLTNDLYSNRHPSWSPNGALIAYSTDAGRFSDLSALQFGTSDLAIYDIKRRESYLLTDTPANEFTPVWSPDGTALAFISDESGLCNLYVMPLQVHPAARGHLRAETIRRITHANTGVVGVTEDNPALTWARAADRLIFSGFSRKGWDLFALDGLMQTYRDYQDEIGFDDDTPTAISSTPSKEAVAKKDWISPLFHPDAAIETKRYSARLRPEFLLFGGAASSDSLYFIGYLAFGDMLSNQRLNIAVNLTEVLDESDVILAYINRAHRLNYAIRGVQFVADNGSFSMGNDEFDISVERGISADFSWPFNKFARVEFGLEGWMTEGHRIVNDEEQPEEEFFYAIPSLAYVRDTSLYTYLGPLDGNRSRLSIRPAIGELSFVTFMADTRQYLHLTRRSALAFRLVALSSVGENARVFEVGGPLTFRGQGLEDDLDDDEKNLTGTNILLGNMEYRFPLLPVDLLRGALFADMGVGWEDDAVSFDDVRTAYGAGVRFPLNGPFGLLSLRVDVSQETDFSRVGPAKVLFSIANDF